MTTPITLAASSHPADWAYLPLVLPGELRKIASLPNENGVLRDVADVASVLTDDVDVIVVNPITFVDGARKVHDRLADLVTKAHSPLVSTEGRQLRRAIPVIAYLGAADASEVKQIRAVGVEIVISHFDGPEAIARAVLAAAHPRTGEPRLVSTVLRSGPPGPEAGVGAAVKYLKAEISALDAFRIPGGNSGPLTLSYKSWSMLAGILWGFSVEELKLMFESENSQKEAAKALAELKALPSVQAYMDSIAKPPTPGKRRNRPKTGADIYLRVLADAGVDVTAWRLSRHDREQFLCRFRGAS